MIYIYNNKNNTYRERLAYEINEHCSKNNIKYLNYFYHEHCSKNKKENKSQKIKNYQKLYGGKNELYYNN